MTSVVLEGALICAFIVMPLLSIDVLPVPSDVMAAFVVAPPPPAPPPPAPAVEPPAPRPVTPQPVVVAVVPVPIEAPPSIAPEVHVDNSFERRGLVEGVTSGAIDGVLGGDGDVISPPPLPPAPPAPVRVGGDITPPRKIRDVAPVYPAIAQAAGIQGFVIIEAIIGEDGTVTNARVLSGNPLLHPAALAAVRQWVFTPTLLNGVPTPVVMSVTVNFRLR